MALYNILTIYLKKTVCGSHERQTVQSKNTAMDTKQQIIFPYTLSVFSPVPR
jgi:hypothetical protein